MSEVVWVPGGLVGWRILRNEPLVKEEGAEEEHPVVEDGAGLATRKEGDELLFASRDEKPCIWIPIGDFVVEPSTIPEYEPERETVPAEGGTSEAPASAPPFGLRRRDKK